MRFSPFLPQKDDVANQVMMCHRVPHFRVKHEKTTGFQGKMDFGNTPIGDAIFFAILQRIFTQSPQKATPHFSKFYLHVRSFYFCPDLCPLLYPLISARKSGVYSRHASRVPPSCYGWCIPFWWEIRAARRVIIEFLRYFMFFL